MPRASWRGFLKLSLVCCPVYLAPATTRTRAIRLNQVWRPRDEPAEDRAEEDEVDEPPMPAPTRGRAVASAAAAEHAAAFADPAEQLAEPEETAPATRIALRPHNPDTGRQIERDEVVKGYQYEKGKFVTFTPEELKSIEVESSKIIDLDSFVPRIDLDPVYFDTPYYLYPDGPIAVEPFRVIAQALAETGRVGLGRIVLSRRERMAMLEPRGAGMVLITLRAAEEVRPAEFPAIADAPNSEMVEIAGLIIERRSGAFDPSGFRDRYQDALKALIDAKLKGRTVRPTAEPAPPPTHDLLAALKRSLAQEQENDPAAAEPNPGEDPTANQAKPKRKTVPRDRRQASLLLPVAGKGRKAPARTTPARTTRRQASRKV